MELKSIQNILYLTVVKGGTPLFVMDFLQDGNKISKAVISEYFSTMAAFLNMFANNSTFFIEHGDIEISYEKDETLSVIYAAHDISEEMRSKIQLYLDIIKSEYQEKLISNAFDNADIYQLQQCAADLFRRA
ncbi:MAG: hypothetical protein BAJALOKI3v1_500008 [Promethearchaeota archaeon]|nr:MAG: hypothetical protein BAJALOKI3v1_500008 [Candidatus Lokiarchaeota archaeon]